MREFLTTYKDAEGNNPIVQQIQKAIETDNHTHLNSFYFDYDSLPPNLKLGFRQDRDFAKFAKRLEKGIKDLIHETDEILGGVIKEKDINIRIRRYKYNLSDSKFDNLIKISNINSDYFNVPIVTRGIVVGITDNKIKMTKTKMRCRFCKFTVSIDFNAYNNYNLDQCGNSQCKAEKSYMIVPEKSTTKNAQILTIEELTIDNYSSPAQINVLITGDMVNKFDVGDTVIVTGDMRLDVYNEDAINDFRKKLSTVSYYNQMLNSVGGSINGVDFDFIIEANFVEKLQEKNIKYSNFTKEELEVIEVLKKNPHMIQVLVNSFAPRIYGHDLVKESLIYQLIGGLGRSIDSDIDNRGEINLMLYGEPGTGKTELMLFSKDLASKKRYLVGGNVTQAGLLGGIDNSNNKNRIVAGDVALCDGGIMYYDEFNEAKEEVINVLNEVLEKQTATITKIKKGEWRTTLSMLTSTNPIKGGKHNRKKNFNENIGIKFSFLSRMDAIFVFLDVPDPERDEKIVDNINKTYRKQNIINDPYKQITKELLAKFLYLMKNSDIIPELTQEAEEAAKKFYLKLRTFDFNKLVNDVLGNSGATVDDIQNAVVSITTRQYQSIIRFATARARLLGKRYVDVNDVEAARNIIEHMMKTIGFDINTGKMDANLLIGKETHTEVSKEKQFFNLLQKMCEGSENGEVDKDTFITILGKEPKWRDTGRMKMMQQLSSYEEAGYIKVLNGRISITTNG